VLIADDHAVVRKGVRLILQCRPDIEVCGEAEDGQEAINSTISLRPTLIIMDLNMPILGGFEAAKVIREMLPNIRIIFYSIEDGDQVVSDARSLGDGFVSKSELVATLLDAVEIVVLHKSTYFPDAPTHRPTSVRG
jgi:DNA-binding NarL/FixJ family response regulator